MDWIAVGQSLALVTPVVIACARGAGLLAYLEPVRVAEFVEGVTTVTARDLDRQEVTLTGFEVRYPPPDEPIPLDDDLLDQLRAYEEVMLPLRHDPPSTSSWSTTAARRHSSSYPQARCTHC